MISISEVANQAVSRLSESTNKAVDAFSHSAPTAKETINQTTNSAVNTLNQSTSQAVESVNQATEKAKASLEDSINKVGNMSRAASDAIKSAINGTVNDWIDSHPVVFWLVNHPLVFLAILLLFILSILGFFRLEVACLQKDGYLFCKSL